MGGQRVGYIRVSSLDQATDRQLEGVAVNRTFTDRLSIFCRTTHLSGTANSDGSLSKRRSQCTPSDLRRSR